MGRIILSKTTVTERRTIDSVLSGERPPQGASPTGSTYWKRLLSCPREHYLGNLVQVKRKGFVEALDVGTLFHMGLEIYYVELWKAQQGQRLVRAPEVAAFAAIEPFSGEPGYEDTYPQVQRMLDAYFTNYISDRWEVIAVEFTLEAQDVSFPWTSRFDLAVIDHSVADGALYTVEHKSARSLDANVVEGYTLNLQVLGQIWLFQREVDLSAYPPYLGSYVNIVSKHKTPQMVRVPVTPTPAALANWERSQQYFWTLEELYKRSGYPQNFSACTRHFRKCDFFDVCRFRPEATLEELKELGKDQGDAT